MTCNAEMLVAILTCLLIFSLYFKISIGQEASKSKIDHFTRQLVITTSRGGSKNYMVQQSRLNRLRTPPPFRPKMRLEDSGFWYMATSWPLGRSTWSNMVLEHIWTIS